MNNTHTRTRITYGDSVEEAIIKMGDGNPGAAIAIRAIMEHNQNRPLAEDVEEEVTRLPEEMRDEVRKGLKTMTPLLTLDDAGVHGHQIWTLYKDVCKEDGEKLCDMIADVEAKKISVENFQRSISRRGEKNQESMEI